MREADFYQIRLMNNRIVENTTYNTGYLTYYRLYLYKLLAAINTFVSKHIITTLDFGFLILEDTLIFKVIKGCEVVTFTIECASDFSDIIIPEIQKINFAWTDKDSNEPLHETHETVNFKINIAIEEVVRDYVVEINEELGE